MLAAGADGNDAAVHDMEIAVLMIQHLRSWFDPKTPPVVVPVWRNAPRSAEATAGSTDIGAQTSGPSATTAAAAASHMPITKILMNWCLCMCRITIESKDFDPHTMRNASVKECIEDFRRLHAELAGQVEL
jgi:hypothetical protein